jgi:hypothetical protein
LSETEALQPPFPAGGVVGGGVVGGGVVGGGVVGGGVVGGGVVGGAVVGGGVVGPVPSVGVVQSIQSDRRPEAELEMWNEPGAFPVFVRYFWMFWVSGVFHSGRIAQWLPSWMSDQ